MKKTISLLSNLLLSSTLLWGVPSLNAQVVNGPESIVNDPTDIPDYCHMKFPPVRDDTLSWVHPVLEETAGNAIDFYGRCDHDPMGKKRDRHSAARAPSRVRQRVNGKQEA